jgi:GPH family glycoside/pentoside/hexuronide:cation symporter
MRIYDVCIPLFGSAIALWMVASYPITEQRAYDIRAQLETLRGTPTTV